MPYLNEKEKENIDLAVRAIINKLLHRPTMYIKDRATKENSEVYVDIFEEMFSSKWDLRKSFFLFWCYFSVRYPRSLKEPSLKT